MTLDGSCRTVTPRGVSKKSPAASALTGAFSRCHRWSVVTNLTEAPAMSIHGQLGNQLLAHLPPAELRRLIPKMRPVSLDFKQVLYGAKAPIDRVYFPNRGTASALTIMEDGSAIEVATIGREGVVGLGILVGGKTSANEVVMQIAGDGLCMDSKVLVEETKSDTPLRQLLLRYHAAFLHQVSYSVACNGLHPIQQRCCRWLLMTRDRVDSDEIA